MAENAYVTTDDLAAWVDDSPARVVDADGASRATILHGLILAASRKADAYCGRVFYKTAAEARTFRVTADGYVRFVDMIAGTLTAASIDNNLDDTVETALASTDYLLEPFTDPISHVTALRYQSMCRRSAGAYRFIPGQLMSLTADWGYTEGNAAPDAVQTAVKIYAARLYLRRKAKFGRVVVPETGVGETLPKFDPDEALLLDPYVHQWTHMFA